MATVNQIEIQQSIEGRKIATHCGWCAKKLPRWNGKRGQPRKFCKGMNCQVYAWRRDHPRKKIDTGDLI